MSFVTHDLKTIALFIALPWDRGQRLMLFSDYPYIPMTQYDKNNTLA
jgi:hypothetical protein